MAKNKIPTGQAAENAFVTGMGGKLYGKKSGSQATDIILHHPEHGKIDGEMKAGGTIDFSQMRMDVDHASGKLRQTIGSVQSSGDVGGQYQRRSGKPRDVVGLVQRITRDKFLTPGTQNIERVSRSTGQVKQDTRPAAMGEVPTKRLSLNNRNAVDMMKREDPIHVAIHHKTGEVALIPTKDEHAHLGDKMGLKKTITYDHLGGDDHGHKDTLGVKLRGPRAKGSTFNASVESSSGAMVNAVKDAGGHVFKSLDHATEHLRSHGWGAETGHAMSESVGLLLQGKYHEAVVLNEVVSGLYSTIGLSAMQTLRDRGRKKEETGETAGETTGETEDTTDTTAAPAGKSDKDLTPAQRRRRKQGEKDAQDAMDQGETEVQIDVETGDAIVPGKNPFEDIFGPFGKPTPGSGKPEPAEEPEASPSGDPDKPAGPHKQMDPDGNPVNPPMPYDPPLKGEEKRSNISPSGANESVFHITSVLREEDDEDYSDDEISRDKDPDAAGGPYSEDDIKVTQDPRDAAPGMDPVADPPTLQAKQVTTGMAYKAPAAAGTMQTMLPGGEHDAIMKQYPDLIENLLGGENDMKGFLMDPKDKKKKNAACAIMAMLDKKLKENKTTRLNKILNTTKPPAIPGSEGY